jgi:CheY-like chemotaxis protein
VSEAAGFVVNCNDDEASRYVIGRHLRNAGYEVRDATTGGEALALAPLGPLLIVLDVSLPDLSGFDVCRRLKADRGTAQIPVPADLRVVHLFRTPGRRP